MQPGADYPLRSCRKRTKNGGLQPLMVADYFLLAVHHEKGGCTPGSSSPLRKYPPPPSNPQGVSSILKNLAQIGNNKNVLLIRANKIGLRSFPRFLRKKAGYFAKGIWGFYSFCVRCTPCTPGTRRRPMTM
jgi:hypothetical protein